MSRPNLAGLLGGYTFYTPEGVENVDAVRERFREWEVKHYRSETHYGTQFIFGNGFGASLICNGYGQEDGRLEVAVTDDKRVIIYDTPITDDVCGYLWTIDAIRVMMEIQQLEKRENAD